MQTLQLTFMALLLAHLLADFPLQFEWIVQNKSSRPLALACHGLIHWALAWTCLLIFASAQFLSWRSQALIAVYFAAHLLIDKLKCWLIAKEIWGDNATAFSVDQALHVIAVAATSLALTWSNLGRFPQAIVPPLPVRTHLLEIATVYLSVVVTGGYLIRYLTKSFRSTMDDQSDSGSSAADSELKNAGLYIGYLERFLILTAIIAQSATLIGLIFAGKSIARFPELKKPSFAEYFLIGTLLSVSLAVLGRLLLQQTIYGSITFK